jgi:hypothetical protein
MGIPAATTLRDKNGAFRVVKSPEAVCSGAFSF